MRREIANALRHINDVGDPFVDYAAGLLYAFACDNEPEKRATLAEMRVTASLTRCAVRTHRRETLVSLLRPLSVLTSHSNDNKGQLLEVFGSLDLLIDCLKLCRIVEEPGTSASSNVDRLTGELAGVVLRNVSSVVALDEAHRARLRSSGCFELLLAHLRASSLRIVANAAGTLWNLTAKHPDDQRRFVQLGAPAVLRSLTASKHSAIAAASRAALKNLSGVSAYPMHSANANLRDDSDVSTHPSSARSGSPFPHSLNLLSF